MEKEFSSILVVDRVDLPGLRPGWRIYRYFPLDDVQSRITPRLKYISAVMIAKRILDIHWGCGEESCNPPH